MATEAILAELSPVNETPGKPKIAIVAHDLRYDGKTNQRLVRDMIALGDKVELHTFGKFSPFDGANVVNHGFETDKRKLMSALNQMDALVFSSRVDNYPLILCEALSIGVPVIATHSDAAQEVLRKAGGKTFAAEEVLSLVQMNKTDIAQTVLVPRSAPSASAVVRRTVVNRCWRNMSRSIRICSYLLLPLIYLLVNVKIAQLGESFPSLLSLFYPFYCCCTLNESALRS